MGQEPPTPSHYRVQVTPEAAKEWLERNTRNRNPRIKKVAEYVAAMRAGRWVFTGDPIQFDTERRLINGQHRLQAVVESGITQEFLVVTDLPAEAQLYMDQGSKRTPGDQMRLTFPDLKDTTVVAAIASTLIRLERGDFLTRDQIISAPDVVEWCTPRLASLTVAAHRTRRVRQAVRVNPSVCGAAAWLSARNYPSQADHFWSSLASGEGLVSGDPILTLRNKLMHRVATGARWTAPEEFYYVIRSWNAHIGDETLQRLQLPRNSNGALTPADLEVR